MKTHKREQSLKMGKQAKENLLKQREDAKVIKQAQTTAAELQEKFDAQKAVIEDLAA